MKLSAFVFAILAATRLPLAPKYLYYFDSVNFALALDDFNPAKHQPQPPGYPMFVAVMRLLHLVIPNAEHVLLFAGIAVTTAAAVLLWRLSDEMFDSDSALLALSIFLFTPPCWFGGITNQVRLSLTLCSAGVALLAWRALRSSGSATPLYLTFAALGVGAGFRPALGVQLVPLLLWVWWRTGRSAPRLATGILIAAAATAPWIGATAVAAGGLPQWLDLMWVYSRDQFQGSSAAFGAPVASAWKMAARALMWNGLAAAAWIWAVPFVWRRSRAPRFDVRVAFLLVWGLPILLFSAFIHIGDPDQALGSVVPICVAGGAILAAFLRQLGSRRVVMAAIGAASVNALLFFAPPGRAARASSYGAVAAVDRDTRSVFDAIRSIAGEAPAAVLDYRARVTWRQISYYFPDHYVVSLSADPGAYSYVVRRRETLSAMRPASTLPGPRRVILIAPLEDSSAGAGWRQQGSAYYRDVEPGSEIRVGPYRLVQP